MNKAKRPLLQIALDTLTIEEAIQKVEVIKDYIDVIEVGTVLLGAEGAKTIRILRALYPDKLLVADGKIADAGKVFANLFFSSGANLTTVICAAETPTILETVKEAKRLNPQNEVQIELTHNFTWKQAKEWRAAGAIHAVWHRSRDLQVSGKKWSDDDLLSIKKLLDLGFIVSVTGGITVNDVKFFQDLKIAIFIAGRELRGSNALQVAKDFHYEFEKYYA